MNLQPCPTCNRHVAATDPVCPFCGVDQAAAAPREVSTTRRTRAAVFASAATLAIAGCGPKPKPVATDTTTGSGSALVAPPPDAAVEPPPDRTRPEHSVPMPYGAPPARRRLV